MKKKLFCFVMLVAYLLVGSAFAKEKKNAEVESSLDYKIIDEWNVEITGLEGKKDICFVFTNIGGQFKQITVYVNEIPYKLWLSGHKDSRSFFQKNWGEYQAHDTFYEFSLSDYKKTKTGLPDSVRLSSIYEMTMSSINIYEKGSKVYVDFGFVTFDRKTKSEVEAIRAKQAKEEQKRLEREEEQRERKEKEEKIEKILAKMGYNLKDPYSAEKENDFFVYRAFLYGITIQDFNYDKSYYIYFVQYLGSFFYIISKNQLKHSYDGVITETLFLEYSGKYTYRQKYGIEECNVFKIMDEKKRETIEDVIDNPDKYMYLLDQ